MDFFLFLLPIFKLEGVDMTLAAAFLYFYLFFLPSREKYFRAMSVKITCVTPVPCPSAKKAAQLSG